MAPKSSPSTHLATRFALFAGPFTTRLALSHWLSSVTDIALYFSVSSGLWSYEVMSTP